MPAPKDLVFQTSTTTGTSDFDLNVGTHRTFEDAFGTGAGNSFDYFIVNLTPVSGAEWEIGTGYIDGTSKKLIRTPVNSSATTNPASPVKTTFGAGTKNCTNDIPSNYQVRTSTNSVTDAHAVVFDGTSGSLIKSAGIALGTIASQAANNVSITGGSVTGITDLLPADGGTGLSTYAAGDLLYAATSNPTALSKLVAATNGNVLKLASGLPSWGVPFSVALKTFTGNGTYTPATGLVAALVFCTGAGGAGLSIGSLSTTGKLVAGGGGGAGATVIDFLLASSISGNQTITIGTGGSTGSANAIAGSGTDTSFGSLLIAKGGNGAAALTVTSGTQSSYVGVGGAGGLASASTGTATSIKLSGGSGSSGSGTYLTNNNAGVALSGFGGGSFWGNGGTSVSVKYLGGAVSGQAGPVYGSGGSAAAFCGNTSTTGTGGAGAAGFIAVLEFIAA